MHGVSVRLERDRHAHSVPNPKLLAPPRLATRAPHRSIAERDAASSANASNTYTIQNRDRQVVSRSNALFGSLCFKSYDKPRQVIERVYNTGDRPTPSQHVTDSGKGFPRRVKRVEEGSGGARRVTESPAPRHRAMPGRYAVRSQGTAHGTGLRCKSLPSVSRFALCEFVRGVECVMHRDSRDGDHLALWIYRQ